MTSDTVADVLRTLFKCATVAGLGYMGFLLVQPYLRESAAGASSSSSNVEQSVVQDEEAASLQPADSEELRSAKEKIAQLQSEIREMRSGRRAGLGRIKVKQVSVGPQDKDKPCGVKMKPGDMLVIRSARGGIGIVPDPKRMRGPLDDLGGIYLKVGTTTFRLRSLASDRGMIVSPDMHRGGEVVFGIIDGNLKDNVGDGYTVTIIHVPASEIHRTTADQLASFQ